MSLGVVPLFEHKLNRITTQNGDIQSARQMSPYQFVLLKYFNPKWILKAEIAQLGERETEDLKVACSIHAFGIF